MEVLRVKDLSFSYPNSNKEVLSRLNFSINSGDFVLLMGETGSGKSTLLKLLKKELAPLGSLTGEIVFNSLGKSGGTASIDVGFVGQNPSLQVVTDNVYSELSFGLESLGVNNSQIRSRVAEIAVCFGLESKFREHTASLSGGKLQLLNLASVMVMTPQLLLLDEPTSQLDPVAAAELLASVKRLNQELGLTVIIAEHRTEEVMPLCNRVIALKQGGMLCDEPVRRACELLSRQSTLADELPTATRLYSALSGDLACPISISEGRELLSELTPIGRLDTPEPNRSRQKAVEMKNVCFRYGRELPDVLRNLDLTVYEGECLCLFGGNASGKTTVLSCLSSVLKPYCGKIEIFGKNIKAYKGDSLYRQCLSFLPQEVTAVFSKNTVGEELADIDGETFSLRELSHLHPYDLSGGEMQLLALAKAIAAKPRLLLLDEPAKGLDHRAKQRLIEALKKLKAQGLTIILVTHEAELAAEIADRCALFFDGACVCVEACRDFLLHNSYFTTPMVRMTRQLDERVISVDEALSVYKKGSEEQ